jgi:hypothetical protein
MGGEMSMPEFLKTESGSWHVKCGHNLLGELFPLEDGYLYWWPKPSYGAWSPWMLRAIADKIDELNKPWDDEVAEAMKQIPKDEPK